MSETPTLPEATQPELKEQGKESSARAPVVPGYTLLDELGRGGMGVVYRARQAGLNRIVALKMVLHPDHAGQDARDRFRREAETVARLKHANVVQIHEVGEVGETPFFSMEFVGGGTLAAALSGRPQSPAESARLVQTLGLAVQAAHDAGVVHRDLKPANVLLAGTRDEGQGIRADGTSPVPCPSSLVPKISDFGLAKRMDQMGQTASGAVVGTPSYMAPEQAAGRPEHVGPSADVYALGGTLYECLTGRPPFRAETTLETLRQVMMDEPVPPSRLCPGVSRDLETICLKCLEKDPARRYPRAADLADDLGRFLAGEPVRARPVGRPARLWRWCKRNPRVASLAAALLLTLVLGFLAVTFLLILAVERGRELERLKGVAERELDRAESNFKQLFEEIEASTTRLSERPELKEPGLLPMRKELLATARDRYQALVQQFEDSPRAEEELARSWSRLSQIHRALGEKPEALAAARQGVELFKRLLTRDSSSIHYQSKLALAYDFLGNTASDPQEIFRARRRAVELNESILREDSPEMAIARKSQLVFPYYNLGMWYADQRDYKTALEWMTRARRLGEEVDTVRPSSAAADVLAQLCLHMAQLLGERMQYEEALASCKQGIDLYTRLVKENPREQQYVLKLAEAWNRLSLALGKARRSATESLNALRKGCAVLDERVAATASEPAGLESVQIHRAMMYFNLGTVLQQHNQGEEALRVFRKVRDLCEAMLLVRPGDADLRHYAAVSRCNIAIATYLAGAKVDVVAVLQQGRQELEFAIKAAPLNDGRRHDLARILENIGEVHRENGHLEKAAQAYSTAIVQGTQALELGKKEEYRTDLISHYLTLADIERLRARPAEAAAAARGAASVGKSRPSVLFWSAVELALCIPLVGNEESGLSLPPQLSQRRRYFADSSRLFQEAARAALRPWITTAAKLAHRAGQERAPK